MERNPMKNFKFATLTITTALALSLGACSSFERLSRVGETPDFTKMESPTERENYQPVTMPMPETQVEVRQMNSLWSTGRQAFFEDQRARAVGDILTVTIDMENEATLESASTRSRSAGEDTGIAALAGFENYLASKALPDGADPANLAELSSSSSNNNAGSTESEDELELKIAAVVSQILPNGNMVIHGRQEFRVNFEKRVLEVAGVIRPQDITIENAVPYDKIAEARIGYGGKGYVSDVQQPRMGQQIFDILMPY
jgi:flagellar L-ring protein precursor FlgH